MHVPATATTCSAALCCAVLRQSANANQGSTAEIAASLRTLLDKTQAKARHTRHLAQPCVLLFAPCCPQSSVPTHPVPPAACRVREECAIRWLLPPAWHCRVCMCASVERSAANPNIHHEALHVLQYRDLIHPMTPASPVFLIMRRSSQRHAVCCAAFARRDGCLARVRASPYLMVDGTASQQLPSAPWVL